jgi:hypothetical protein
MNYFLLIVCKVRGEYKDLVTPFIVPIIYPAYSTLATYSNVAFLELTCSWRRSVCQRQFPRLLSCRRRLLDVPLVGVASLSEQYIQGA